MKPNLMFKTTSLGCVIHSLPTQSPMHTHFRQSLEVSCRLAHLLTVEQQVSVAPECTWVHVLLWPHGRVVVQAERKVVLDQVLACGGGGGGENSGTHGCGGWGSSMWVRLYRLNVR